MQPSNDYESGSIATTSSYPVSFSVSAPDGPRNRATAAFRFILVLPILFLSAILQSVGDLPSGWNGVALAFSGALGGAGLIALPVAVMLVVRQKYPKWWFEWNLELLRFVNRIIAYAACLTDEYPSTDEQQAVSLKVDYPATGNLNRGLPLIKWILVLPHYVVLAALCILLPFALVAAWLAILLTGRYPSALFSFVEGVLRWVNRVTAYAYILVTDEYPPFRLAP